MRKGLLVSFLALLAGAGGALAQAPAAMPAWSADDSRGAIWAGRGDADGSGCCGWGSVDYLLWWIKDQPLPPFFVLTGDPTTPNPGALNAGGFPVSGEPRIDYGSLSGVRATVGTWLGGDGGLGVEVGGFILPKHTKTLRYASDANGNPVLGFRYIDTPGNPATPNAEDVFQASVPAGNAFGVGPFAGSLAIASTTRLWGTEFNAVLGSSGGGGSRLQALAGFRYVDLSESLDLALQSTAIGGGAVNFLGNTFPAPAAILTSDFFHTRNQFYGGQLGARGEYGLGDFTLGVTGKIGLGDMHEVVEVRGTSTLSGAGPVATVPVGQFAGPSNIGRRTRDDFAVVPEFEIKLGYQVTHWLRATVGYDFLYISEVVRPGSQVDLVVNDSVNPVNGVFGKAPLDTTAFPRPLFNRTDFWAQGLTFGLELRF
jgi:hypothetical protein